MSCARLQERLYDEDVREALVAGAPAPADLRPHLADCDECRAEWSAAREDALSLREGLEDAPPPHLQASIASTWSKPRADLLRTIDWTAAFSWAGAAGALTAGCLQGLSLPVTWSVAAFAVAATCAFAAQVTAAALWDTASGRA